jgi:hypothetical protein
MGPRSARQNRISSVRVHSKKECRTIGYCSAHVLKSGMPEPFEHQILAVPIKFDREQLVRAAAAHGVTLEEYCRRLYQAANGPAPPLEEMQQHGAPGAPCADCGDFSSRGTLDAGPERQR